MTDELDKPDGQTLGPRRTEAATQASAKKPRSPGQIASFEKAKAERAAKIARRRAIRDGGELPIDEQLTPKVTAALDPKPAAAGPEIPIVAWPDGSKKPTSTTDAPTPVEPGASVDASNDGPVATLRSSDASRPEKPEAHIEPYPEKTRAPAQKPLLERLIEGFKEGAGLD